MPRRTPKCASCGKALGNTDNVRLQFPTVAGKPEPYIYEVARSLLSDRHRVAIVGDDLEADIAGGKRAGLTTILVLSGTTSAQALAAAAVEPDLVVDDLASLVNVAGVSR